MTEQVIKFVEILQVSSAKSIDEANNMRRENIKRMNEGCEGMSCVYSGNVSKEDVRQLVGWLDQDKYYMSSIEIYRDQFSKVWRKNVFLRSILSPGSPAFGFLHITEVHE